MAEYSAMTPAERDAYCAEQARNYRERQAARPPIEAAEIFEAEEPAHIRDEQEANPGLAELATLATEQRPLRRASPPAESFPLDALGDVLGGAARAIVDKVQCADAVAASSVLAMASLAAQPHADVVIPATGNARPLSLFIVSVAATGDRKSAADHEAGWPMREREKRLREKYEIDAKDYRHAKRAYDAAISKAEKTSGGRAAIEAAIHGVGEEPTAPRLPILTTDEPTIEGLAKLFDRGQPSLGLFSDEGGAFLGGHALANENRLRTLASLSSIWDGSPIRRIRAGDGATILPGRRLALHLMLQPAASAGLLSDPVAADQGLLSRILVCSPSSTAGSRFQKPLAPTTEPALKAYRDGLRTLLEKPPKLIDGTAAALDPRHLPFSSAAAAAWGRLADEIERKLAPGGVYEPIRRIRQQAGRAYRPDGGRARPCRRYRRAGDFFRRARARGGSWRLLRRRGAQAL